MSTEAIITELQFRHPKDKYDFNTHLHNTELFLKLWKDRVRPEIVIKDLRDWRCGTQACAGGHLATWPEFKAIGGAVTGLRAPFLQKELLDGVFVGTNGVAEYLFRNRDLFSSVYFDEKYSDLNDYDLVIKRFEEQIKYLENKIKL